MKYKRIQKTQCWQRLVWVLLLIVGCSAGGYAQDSTSALADFYQGKVSTENINKTTAAKLKTVVTLEKGSQKLISALQSIARQTGLKLSYSEQVIPYRQKVTIKKTKLPAEQALWDILEDTGYRFGISASGQLVLVRMQHLSSESQQETITGTVTDGQSGETLPGVNILVKGTSTGTSTDSEGNFELTVENQQDTLVVSFMGYQTQEVPVDGRKEIMIALQQQVVMGEEMVVVGFGTQEKRDVTGSITSIDSSTIKKLQDQSDISISQALHGRIAGVKIGQTTESGDNPNIQIQGRSSLSGESKPLIVVDGVTYRANLNDINPNDIESLDVLKGPSASAVYGSQAANGVIIITTKKGGAKMDKPVISYSSKYTFQRPTKEFTTGSAEDYIEDVKYQDLFNAFTKESRYMKPVDNYDPSTTFKTGDQISSYNEGRSINWYNELTNDHPYTHNQYLSLSNNMKSVNYFLSFDYTGQKGYMKNEGYQRISGRFNIQSDVKEWLVLSLQSSITINDYGGSGESPSTSSRYNAPYFTPYQEDGTLQRTIRNEVNPIRVMRARPVDDRLNLFGNFGIRIDVPFVKGLSYTGNFSDNWRQHKRYNFEKFGSQFRGQGSKYLDIIEGLETNNTIHYKRAFNNTHNVNITLLYQAEKIDMESTEASSSIFPYTSLGYNSLQAGDAEQQRAGSGGYTESSLATMGRIHYGYNHKYLITGTVRKDGFSGFGKNNKYGIFPSLAVAWVASEESFINQNIKWIDNLKLRISYGKNGNRTIGRYQTLPQVGGSYGYVAQDGTPLFTQEVQNFASPNLQWETKTGFNYGIDFGVLSNRLTGSIIYYRYKTKNLLYNVDVPGVNKFGSFPSNLGRLDNQGIEVSLQSGNIRNDNLQWNTTVIYSRNRNKLKELLGNGKDLPQSGLFIGKSLSAIYDYRINGFWQEDDDIPGYSALGAYKVVDRDGDGIISNSDKAIIGYESPAYSFSIGNDIHYKNWDLRIFINSIQGGDNRYMASNDIVDWEIINNETHFNNHFAKAIDYWTPKNSHATYQKPNLKIGEGTAGTRYAQRSFVRLQDVTLSYNFPINLLNKTEIQNLRIFFSGKNIATWTSWRGWDPESGQDISRGGRPVLKGYTVGINIKF